MLAVQISRVLYAGLGCPSISCLKKNDESKTKLTTSMATKTLLRLSLLFLFIKTKNNMVILISMHNIIADELISWLMVMATLLLVKPSGCYRHKSKVPQISCIAIKATTSLLQQYYYNKRTKSVPKKAVITASLMILHCYPECSPSINPVVRSAQLY